MNTICMIIMVKIYSVEKLLPVSICLCKQFEPVHDKRGLMT